MQISRWPGLTAGQLWDQIIALESLADAGVRETVADGVTTRFATLDDMRSRIAEMRAEYDRRSIELEGGVPARRRRRLFIQRFTFAGGTEE